LFVWKNQRWLKGFGFFEVEHGVTYDDNDVVDGYFSGGRPVQANHAALALSLNDVSLKTLTVVDIDNLNARLA